MLFDVKFWAITIPLVIGAAGCAALAVAAYYYDRSKEERRKGRK